MRFFRKTRRKVAHTGHVTGIRANVLDMIFEASNSSHPKEFMGLMRAESGIITELVLLPGTTSGDSHAVFYRHMLPIDYSIVGTVHSHPSPYPEPSDADLHLFQRYGRVHIICAWPYNMGSWLAYDEGGYDRELEVV